MKLPHKLLCYYNSVFYLWITFFTIFLKVSYSNLNIAIFENQRDGSRLFNSNLRLFFKLRSLEFQRYHIYTWKCTYWILILLNFRLRTFVKSEELLYGPEDNANNWTPVIVRDFFYFILFFMTRVTSSTVYSCVC